MKNGAGLVLAREQIQAEDADGIADLLDYTPSSTNSSSRKIRGDMQRHTKPMSVSSTGRGTLAQFYFRIANLG